MSDEKESAKSLKTLIGTPETSVRETSTAATAVDIEKPGQLLRPGTPIDGDNNHFFEEKLKERPPPGVNASLIFLYAIFFTEFTTGFINLNSCPINILVPIFLIVSGFLGAVSKALSKCENKFAYWTVAVLINLNIIWHILGSYEVYKEYQPNYEPDPKNRTKLYCNRTVYLMAFWILNFEYTMLVLFLMLSACYMLMRADFKPTKY